MGWEIRQNLDLACALDTADKNRQPQLNGTCAAVPMALVYAQPGAAAIAAGLKKQMSCKVRGGKNHCFHAP